MLSLTVVGPSMWNCGKFPLKIWRCYFENNQREIVDIIVAETAQGENVILPYRPLLSFPTMGTSPSLGQNLRVELCWALSHAHIPYTKPLIVLTDKSVISPDSSPLRRHFFPGHEQCTVNHYPSTDRPAGAEEILPLSSSDQAGPGAIVSGQT